MIHQTVTTVSIFVSLLASFVPPSGGARWPMLAARHVFPDGYVDRTISVVVRDQVVRIEYSVGMNDITMESLLAEWSAQDPRTLTEAENENEVTGAPMPSLRPGPLRSNSNLVHDPDIPQPAQIAGPDRKHADSKHASTIDSSATHQPARISIDDEDFRNDETLAAQFRERAIEALQPGLIIKCNDQPLEVTAVSNPTRLRRHMSLTVEYECRLPETSKLNKLSIVDSNFENLNGAMRLSLKAAGTAVLTQSNVAPILVRAEAIDLNGLNSDERKKSCSIDVKIILATEPPTTRSSWEKKLKD